MRSLFNTKIRVIIVIVLLLTAGLTILSSVSGQTLPDMLVQGVLAPFRAVANGLTNQVEKYYSYMFRYEALEAENEVLKSKIAQMEDVARQADSVSRENQRLRDLLELKSTHEDYELVDAYIIGWNSTDWSNTFTINRGTTSGLGDQAHHFTVGGDGTKPFFNAGGGAPVDGKGVGPVRGAPADDIGIHQLIVLMGGFEIQQSTQSLIFTGNRVSLSGYVLHLGDLGLQNLIFCVQSLIPEHIAVVFFNLVGNGVADGPEGGNGALDQNVRNGLAGNAAENCEACCQQQDDHNNDLDFCTE